jgi:hypothetical protein
LTRGPSEKADAPEQRQEIWERGQGYPRDERGMPREGEKAYARFKHFLAQGPKRTKTETAKAFGILRGSVSVLASTYHWDARARAWDEQHGLAFSEKTSSVEIEPEIPERLQEVASQPPAQRSDSEKLVATVNLSQVDADIRAKEEEHERKLEEFRSEAELLGRRQMQIARGMTQIVGNTVAEMLAGRETIHPRSIPGFISSACTLAAAAHHGWGRAIGVEKLLLSMERAVAELEQRTIEDAEVIG